MSILDRVFTSGTKMREPEIGFAGRPQSSTINPKLKEMFDEIMASIGDIQNRLAAIEERLEEMKNIERTGPRSRKRLQRPSLSYSCDKFFAYSVI
jgi:hypothetical protein